jgi:hypothetical protein
MKTNETAFNNSVFLPEEEVMADLRRRVRQELQAPKPKGKRTNRYPAKCSHCGNHVPAGEGRLLRMPDNNETRTTVYKWHVWCAEGKH